MLGRNSNKEQNFESDGMFHILDKRMVLTWPVTMFFTFKLKKYITRILNRQV